MWSHEINPARVAEERAARFGAAVRDAPQEALDAERAAARTAVIVAAVAAPPAPVADALYVGTKRKWEEEEEEEEPRWSDASSDDSSSDSSSSSDDGDGDRAAPPFGGGWPAEVHGRRRDGLHRGWCPAFVVARPAAADAEQSVHAEHPAGARVRVVYATLTAGDGSALVERVAARRLRLLPLSTSLPPLSLPPPSPPALPPSPFLPPAASRAAPSPLSPTTPFAGFDPAMSRRASLPSPSPSPLLAALLLPPSLSSATAATAAAISVAADDTAVAAAPPRPPPGLRFGPAFSLDCALTLAVGTSVDAFVDGVWWECTLRAAPPSLCEAGDGSGVLLEAVFDGHPDADAYPLAGPARRAGEAQPAGHAWPPREGALRPGLERRRVAAAAPAAAGGGAAGGGDEQARKCACARAWLNVVSLLADGSYLFAQGSGCGAATGSRITRAAAARRRSIQAAADEDSGRHSTREMTTECNDTITKRRTPTVETQTSSVLTGVQPRGHA